MGMACERIPLRYGVRSDHLLCSVLFISSCIGTLEIIGILILVLNGEISKLATVCAHERSCRIGSHKRQIVLFFFRSFRRLATEGQYRDRQLTQGHNVTTRGYHIICYHLKVITVNSCLTCAR